MSSSPVFKRIVMMMAPAVVLFILTAPGSASLLGMDPVEYPAAMGVLDPYLLEKLDGPEDDMRVLIQFVGQPIDTDIAYAKSMGLDHISSMKVLPAALFEGTRDQIRSLSGYPRTAWMEYDGKLELMMETSLSTINATIAWNSWIRSSRDRFPSINGKGVTVAVVDTGIDAGHPDLDYGEKTIINIKSDIPGGPWYDMENSDTSYGHGTHCAGTIAGNGDASAGARSGVAPEANLIGLCVGDVGITLTNTIQGLEWVYENSKGANQYNIKVVSNSWGGGAAEYNPEDAQSKICQKLTFENNVLVVFAMGNAGRGHHQGETLTASPTGLIPSNIGVAATERDGSGVADFSSRGERGLNQTYPDISAPGVKIWSAAARRTIISAMANMKWIPNPYYLAISGTSMATPHVSGLAALMYQAAPSLTISDRYEDYSGEDSEWWYNYEFNRIHEIEWIMEQSATYLKPDGIPLTNEQEDNGVPEPEDLSETEIGWDGRTIDWAQGYGLVNAEKCVGIALTLQDLRERHPGEKWTVSDAMEIYNGRDVFHMDTENMSTDTLVTGWDAEFARLAQDGDSALLVQNQSRLIWVPEGAQEITVNIHYDPLSLEDRTIGELTFVVDFENDGVFDHEEPFFGSRTSGTKIHTFSVEGRTGVYWAVGVFGRGFKVIRPLQDGEYMELRMEYAIGIQMVLSVPQEEILEMNIPISGPMVSTWEEGTPSSSYNGGVIGMKRTTYDLNRVIPYPEEEDGEEEKGLPWNLIAVILLIIVASIAGYTYLKKRRNRS
ncbi:MAG: S8 family serine peptidase [Candidatus Thermoplasmatota archaeon]|nr:S8 family serine peptidase [Candidatus Thermoplasmatota archaeon]